jgi:hypothetical protein
MNVHESLQRFSLVPSNEALPEIRALLAAEAEAERSGTGREEDLALLCCVQLFSRGLLKDVERIWEAKDSGFDLGCYLDAEFLCGAGLAETKGFLAHGPFPAAAKALAYIETCQRNGAFVDFSPETHLQEYRRYFGI